MSNEPRLSLAELPEMNPGPVCRLALDGTVELANRAARELLGDSLVGACWFDVSPSLPSGAWERVLAGERGVGYEGDVGERCYVFSLAHVPGSPAVFVYGSDVTALKLAERRLAELARFPEKNPWPVARLDLAGRIILANRAARTLFRDDDLVGKQWLAICPEMNADAWRGIVSATQPVHREVKVHGRDLSFEYVPPEGGAEVFVYGADVTDQKESGRALRQHERMATLGTLAAGLAHELNNPAAATRRAASQLSDQFARLQAAELALRSVALDSAGEEALADLAALSRERATHTSEFSAIARGDHEAMVEEWLDGRGIPEPWEIAASMVDLGYDAARLEALAARVGDGAIGPVLRWAAAAFEVHSLFEEIGHSSARLSEIVTAMKSYSYVGQAPVQTVDVNEGIRNTLIVMRSKLKDGVTVVQELATDLPAIQAYGGELNQVWTNLIDNAVAATNGTGTIVVRSAPRGTGVVVEVEDDGAGIPREHQDRIFDAFFTTKPPGQGTGLGLHTCYNIVVKKHEGTLEVVSQPGRTRFIVGLPAACPIRAGTA